MSKLSVLKKVIGRLIYIEDIFIIDRFKCGWGWLGLRLEYYDVGSSLIMSIYIIIIYNHNIS